MHADAAIRHYLNLLDGTSMEESIAWTVIISDEKPLDISEIATALSGGAPPEMLEKSPRMAYDHFRNINLVVPVKSETRINLIELGPVHTNYTEFNRWMSAGRRIWSASWHTAGGERLTCVENDEIIFGLSEAFDVDRPFGANVAAAQRELDIMRQSSLSDRQAAALSIMELHGRFRLEQGWLDSLQTIIAVDQPIPPGATPPSAFASAEPDLAAHLRDAVPTARRSFFIHLIERLANSYDLRIPEVTTIFDHIRVGSHPTSREWNNLAVETMHLSQGHWYANAANATPEWLRWQAAIAIRHALRSLDNDPQNFESLLSARNALHDTWENLREEIRALPR